MNNYTPPSVEDILSICKLVLKETSIDMDDNLFSLGAESIQIIKIKNKINDSFGTAIGIEDIITAPTPTLLIDRINKLNSPAYCENPIQDRPTKPEETIKWSEEQQYFVTLAACTEQPEIYYIYFKIEINGLLDHERLIQAVRALLDENPDLRAGFDIIKGHYQPGKFTTDDIFAHAGQALWPPIQRENLAPSTLLEILNAKSFDIEQTPLINMALISCTPLVHALAVRIHHAIFDHESLGIFFDKLMQHLQAAEFSKAELQPSSYSSYCAWQTHEAQQAKKQHNHAFWRKQLQSYHEEGAFYDLAKVKVYHKANIQSFSLHKTTTKALRKFSRENGVTPFICLLSLFNNCIHSLPPYRFAPIVIPISRRSDFPNASSMGCFVNTLLFYQADNDQGVNREQVYTNQHKFYALLEHQPFNYIDMRSLIRQQGLAPSLNAPAMFNYLPALPSRQEIGSCQYQIKDFMPNVLDVELAITVYSGENIEVIIQYSPELVSSAEIMAFYNKFEDNLYRLLDEGTEDEMYDI